jgi:hypothetical protein
MRAIPCDAWSDAPQTILNKISFLFPLRLLSLHDSYLGKLGTVTTGTIPLTAHEGLSR